jgi:hypothetical protein
MSVLARGPRRNIPEDAILKNIYRYKNSFVFLSCKGDHMYYFAVKNYVCLLGPKFVCAVTELQTLYVEWKYIQNEATSSAQSTSAIPLQFEQVTRRFT